MILLCKVAVLSFRYSRSDAVEPPSPASLLCSHRLHHESRNYLFQLALEHITRLHGKVRANRHSWPLSSMKPGQLTDLLRIVVRMCTYSQYKGDNRRRGIVGGIWCPFLQLCNTLLEIFVDGLPNRENGESLVPQKFKPIRYDVPW